MVSIEEEIEKLIGSYGLERPVSVFELGASGVNNLTAGLRTGSGAELVWKRYESFGEAKALRYEHRLTRWLGGQGLSFRVPVPLETRAGDTLSRWSSGWQALFPLLSGKAPDREDPAQAHEIGRALGELHLALAPFPQQPRPGVAGYSELALVHPAIPDPAGVTEAKLGLPENASYRELLGWFRHEVAELSRFVEGDYQRLPRQLIHGDYVPGNTLFQGSRLSAVLDFEFAGPEVRALDVAMGLVFVMQLWRDQPLAALGQAFVEGYKTRLQLEQREIEALPMLMRLRNVVSAIWWMGRWIQARRLEQEIARLEWMPPAAAWLGQEGGILKDIAGH